MHLIPIRSIAELFTYGHDSPFIIPALDGTMTLSSWNAPCFVSRAFHEWKLDVPSAATPETPVRGVLLGSSETAMKALLALDEDLRRLALTPHQIAHFFETRFEAFRRAGYSLLFPFEARDHIWLALIVFHKGGWVHASPLRLDHHLPLTPNHYLFIVADRTTA